MTEQKVYAPGVYDISNADYHGSLGISRSMIMSAKKSMLDYYHYHIIKDTRKETTEAMMLGSLVNTLAIEPHKFDEEFCLYIKATGTGSRELNRLIKESAGNKQIISAEFHDQAVRMAQAIHDHQTAAKIINGAAIEQSLFWIDEETGLLCKARPDIWNKKIGVIADIKTAIRPDLKSFTYVAEEKGYHIQAAMILDGTYKANGLQIPSLDERTATEIYSFIVVPKDTDYKPYIYTLGWQEIEFGREEYRNALKIIKICQESGRWSADRETVAEIKFNPWQLSANNANSFLKRLEIYNDDANR